MKKLYWELNKKNAYLYIGSAFLFFLSFAIIMIVASADVSETADIVGDGTKFILPFLAFGAVFGASFMTFGISYLYMLIKPFKQKQYEQVLQIGESVTNYTLFHAVVMIVLGVLPTVVLYVVVRMPILNTHLAQLNEVFSSMSFTGNLIQDLKALLSSIALVSWIIAIPLVIYNDRVLPNMSSKSRGWLITIVIISIWFGLGMLEGIPSFIKGFTYGAEVGALVASGAETTGSLDPTVSYHYLTDIAGVITFIAAYYGFSKYYTIRR